MPMRWTAAYSADALDSVQGRSDLYSPVQYLVLSRVVQIYIMYSTTNSVQLCQGAVP